MGVRLIKIDLDELAKQYGLEILTGAYMAEEDQDGCYHRLVLENVLEEGSG
jgi:hypothetical protein